MRSAEEPWMQDLMVICGELDGELVARHRLNAQLHSCASPSRAPAETDSIMHSAESGAAAVVLLDEPENSDVSAGSHSKDQGDAVKWFASVTDQTVVQGLVSSLPVAVLKNIESQYRNRNCDNEAAVAAHRKIPWPANNINAQNTVSQKFDSYMAALGLSSSHRLPRRTVPVFLEQTCILPKRLKGPGTKLRRWHARWEKNKDAPLRGKGKGVKIPSKVPMVRQSRRKRVFGNQARTCKMAWVREALYEWFMAMRYAIDWKALAAQRQRMGIRRCISRFPLSLLRRKCQQLIEDYCRNCMLQGVRPAVVAPSGHWFTSWMQEYGLSMRVANRRYKCPKWVVAERLRLWWTTLARLRLLCLLSFGYDPEMENFDQSPFHNNEVGAQNKPTLSVAGASEVPLVEGRHDILERWTGNFMTWSNPNRVLSEGPPYCELMFKAAPDGPLVLRLREYCRSRGFGPWLTVACQEKGSYRESDVLNFLDKHLPPMTEDRGWRIMMADDYGPHKANTVFNLCWSRGYVMVPHGGGVTPISQTPDTHLNQHVKREYIALEAEELMVQMRANVPVPCPTKETSIDMMHQVLSQSRLHLDAAGGYKATGASIALDGTEDHLVVNTAGRFFQEEGMRRILDAEMQVIQDEFAAGRLRWRKWQVKLLICKYPAHKAVDAVLTNVGEHHIAGGGLDDSDTEAEANDEGSDDQQEEVVQSSDSESDMDGACTDTAGDRGADKNLEVDSKEACNEVAEVTALSAEEATEYHRSQVLLNTLSQAANTLREVGHVTGAVMLDNHARIERRRQRAKATGSPAVAEALARQRDDEMQKEYAAQRAVQTLNRKRQAAHDIQKKLTVAKSDLKKKKALLAEADNVACCKWNLKTFSSEQLGQGCDKGAGAAGRKRRAEVLDRMARLGSGLSAAQQNDWEWFKVNWDQRMLLDCGCDWGGTFASLMQAVIDDHATVCGNAFSLFMKAQTDRVFAETPVLQVPGCF